MYQFNEVAAFQGDEMGSKRAKPYTLQGGHFPNYADAVTRMSTKNVMSPYLWMAGITLGILIPGIVLTTGPVQIILTSLVAGVIIFGIGVFVYFALTEPDRLQSEEYQIETRKIELLAEPGKHSHTLDLSAEQMPNSFVEGDGAISHGI
ncbi:hypothetical protein G6L58_17215 [Agrobacterium tumefaciens]|uniref:hypothetical protein n=1 Tax=Agrobacterium tumefaciens TaxID=358 RepID=UPI000EF18E6D|nr:hypothetical protein At1D1108_34200 [Agrobacterium tumefaciens]NSY92198.1 hypothetical protein [Agrobacterium tumefaciens]